MRLPAPAWALLHVAACAVWAGAYRAAVCAPGDLPYAPRLLALLALAGLLAAAFARRPHRGRTLAVWLTAGGALAGAVLALVALVGL